MAEQNIEDVMEKLRVGTPLSKIKSPHKMLARYFHLDTSRMMFYYDGSEKRNSDTRVPIHDIVGVIKGEDEDSKILTNIEKHLCFVLFFVRPTRTMYLKAKNEQTRDAWVQGVRYALGQITRADSGVGIASKVMGASKDPDFESENTSVVRPKVIAVPSRQQTQHTVMESVYPSANEYPTDLDFILIGKTGNGKSAAGNAILGAKHFVRSGKMTSETQHLAWGVGLFKGKKIKVVDGPGVGDTELDAAERVVQMHEWLNKAIKLNDRGYHAFLLVLKYGSRFTDEEAATIQFLKMTFGEDFVESHCIILMTCGDNFQSDYADSDKTFDDWCGEQRGGFNDLVRECKGRIVLFNNHAKGRASDAQRKELLRVVASLGGKRYTNELFEKAAEDREKTQVEAQKPKLEMEVMEQIDLITQSINEVILMSQTGDYDHKHRLQELSHDCDKLTEDVRRNDRGTGVLKSLLAKVMNQKQSIDRMSAVLSKGKQDKEEMRAALENMKKANDEVHVARNVQKEETGAWDTFVNGACSVASGAGKIVISPFVGASEFIMKSAISVAKYADDKRLGKR